MKIDWLKPLIGRNEPFTTVYMDATRAGESGDLEVENRWKGLRRTLERQGAEAALLEELGEVLLRPTRVAGPHGRFVVAAEGSIVIDKVLVNPPVREESAHGPLPCLLPAAHAADESVARLVIEVNREGADLTFVDSARALGGSLEEIRRASVSGGHDELSKANAGGWSHRRLENRAEDSWERNAEAVAAQVDRLVDVQEPELVIITGDVRAVALVCGALGKKAKDLLVEVPGGSRNDGVKDDVFRDRLDVALEEFRGRRRDVVLDKYRQEHGRDGAAVSSLTDVVSVLQRGQVSELIFYYSEAHTAARLGERTLWIGPDVLQIASTQEELAGIGVTMGAREVPADVALVRAALGQDAGVTFAEDGSVDLPDGVGAVLRWHDLSTPSDGGAPSLSSDPARLREVG